MTGSVPEQDDANSPLTPEEWDGLIPSCITLRSELNAAEQANILEVEEWAFARKRDVLDEHFLTNLHKWMFGRVRQRYVAALRAADHFEIGPLLEFVRS